MSELMDDIAYLSQEIGPRPAGTEEEQQASIYISDALKKRAGLSAQIEDFSCNSKPELINVILCALPIILSIAAMIKNIVVIPAILVGVLCALFYVLEIIDKPLLSKAFSRGVSQNVVAKYQPATQVGKRTRKVVIVANYDSGKIRKEYGAASILPILQKASAGAIIAIPIIWIIRAIFAISATGAAAIAWNVITIVALVLTAIPIILFILHQTAEYNEAANCNAAGVAAMIELANRIAHTPARQEDPAADVAIHGEAAARAEDLIPEGAEVVYNVAAQSSAAEKVDAAPAETPVVEEPLAAAAVSTESEEQPQESFVFYDDEYGWPEEFAFKSDQDYSAFEEPAPSVPDWYSKAQQSANRPKADNAPVRRSRFASALDEAVVSSQAHYQAVNQAAAAERAANMAAAASAALAARRAYEPAPVQQLESIEPVAQPEPVSPASTEEPVDQVVAVEASPVIQEPAAPVAEPVIEPAVGEIVQEEVQPKEINEPVQEEPEVVAPGSTTAMAPIDVSELRAAAQQARAAAAEAADEVELVQEEPQVEAVQVEETPEESVVADTDSNEDMGRILVDVPEVRMDLPPVELQPQRAPLAEMVPDPALSSQIPRINLDAFGVSTAGNAEIMDNKRAALRNMLPSMSGSITLEASIDEPEEPSVVSRTGSFAPVGLSGSIGPVGDELVEGVDPEDIYVDDADDSSYETTMTETGAYAGPGYMEMPESFGSRIFGRFRKKKDKKGEQSAQEWLGVEDDFNPTEAGAERGSWESFNEENRDRFRDRRKDENIFDDDVWNGGAFSKMREAASGIADKIPQREKASESTAAEEEPRSRRRKVDTTLPLADIITPQVVEEVKKVEDFHTRNVDVEVWFVALGSENAANGGTRAFLAEHAEELRGAMVINLEGLGAGAFTQIGTEGAYKAKGISPRLKRFIKKAQQVSGVTFTNSKLCWRDSIASIAMKRGMQAVTLAGMENGKPAYLAQGDDVMENVEEETLLRRVEFVEAMIRHM